MAKKNQTRYDEKSVIASLKRLPAVTVNSELHLNKFKYVIEINKNVYPQPGIHQLGKLSYLRKLGHIVVRV